MMSIIKNITNMFSKKQSVLSPFELFPIKVLLQLLEKNGNKNVLVSPARIMSILMFLSNFTDNETRKHISKLLSITDDDAIRYLTINSLTPSDNYESWVSEEDKKEIKMENCSSVWIDSTISTSDNFDAISKEWGYEKVIASFSSDEIKQRINELCKGSHKWND